MTHLRDHWEGVSVSEDYILQQWLGGDDSAAFFQTSIAADGRNAVVKLVPGPPAGGADPLDLWQRARQLRHPNLIEILDCGQAAHRGETVLYAVYESPDDTLASALKLSPLNPQESREILDSILDALRYLHAQGLVLGALDADHVVAVGDRIKLSTGALRYAGTSSAYREDVRLLGEFWQQALLPASPRSSDIAAHAAHPDPKARWTLAEIRAALDPPLPPAPPPAPRIASSSPISELPIPESPIPVAPVSERPLSPSLRSTPERTIAYRFLKWATIGAAVVLLLIVALNRPRPAAVATQTQVSAVSLPTETPAPAPKAVAPTVPKPVPAAGKEMWRVIAFTYRSRDAATRKAQQLNQHNPGLSAAVFSPKSRRGYYLVSLGGRMTHGEAIRLQRSSRGKGLPRDLYVQNYSE
jgi:hypothetical protein